MTLSEMLKSTRMWTFFPPFLLLNSPLILLTLSLGQSYFWCASEKRERSQRGGSKSAKPEAGRALMECLRAGEGKAVIRIWMEPQERGRGEGKEEGRGERRIMAELLTTPRKAKEDFLFQCAGVGSGADAHQQTPGRHRLDKVAGTSQDKSSQVPSQSDSDRKSFWKYSSCKTLHAKKSFFMGKHWRSNFLGASRVVISKGSVIKSTKKRKKRSSGSRAYMSISEYLSLILSLLSAY